MAQLEPLVPLPGRATSVSIRLLYLVQSKYTLSGQKQRGDVKGTSAIIRYSDMGQDEN